MARAGRRSAARWASPRLPFAPETPSATPSARRGGRTWTPETLTTTVAAEVIVGAGRATDTDTAHSCRGASLSVQQTAPATAPAPPVPPTTPAARKGHGRRPAARRRRRTPEAGPTCPSAHSRGSQASARGTVKYPRSAPVGSHGPRKTPRGHASSIGAAGESPGGAWACRVYTPAAGEERAERTPATPPKAMAQLSAGGRAGSYSVMVTGPPRDSIRAGSTAGGGARKAKAKAPSTPPAPSRICLNGGRAARAAQAGLVGGPHGRGAGVEALGAPRR
jgi:hypothetical protein